MAKLERSTADAIIEQAELLIGQHGPDGVSLRRLAKLAGSANNTAIQYHFGAKAGLLRAVFARRLPDLDRRRGELLAALEGAGRLSDGRALMEVIWRPLMEQHDHRGVHTYAAFLDGLFRRNQLGDPWRAEAGMIPHTLRAIDLLREAHPALDDDLFRRRKMVVSAMMLGGIADHDGARDPGGAAAGMDGLMIDLLDMGDAAIRAPVSREAVGAAAGTAPAWSIRPDVHVGIAVAAD